MVAVAIEPATNAPATKNDMSINRMRPSGTSALCSDPWCRVNVTVARTIPDRPVMIDIIPNNKPDFLMRREPETIQMYTFVSGLLTDYRLWIFLGS